MRDSECDLPLQPLSKASHSSLVVLLHAYRHTPEHLALVKRAVRRFKSARRRTRLPLQMWSTVDLNHVAAGVVALINR